MNILIIGNNSTVGKSISNLCTEKGIKHSAFSRNEFDLLSPEWQWLNSRKKISHAFICAAATSLNYCEENPKESYKINVTNTIELIKRLAERNIFTVLYSSSQVFDGDKVMPDETTEKSPKNNYGRQKAEVEDYVTESNLPVCVLRITKVMPPYPQGVFENWNNKLAAGEVITPAENMFIAPVTVRQVAEVSLLCAGKQLSGIYNLSASNDISYADAARYMANDLGYKESLVQPVNVVDTQVSNIFRQNNTALATGKISKEGVNIFSPYYAVDYMLENSGAISTCA